MDGDKSKLTQALQLNESDASQGIFVGEIVYGTETINDGSNIGVLSAPCNGQPATSRQQQGSRRTLTAFVGVVYPGIAEYAGVLYIEALGHRRSTFGILNRYRTGLRIEQGGFSITNGKGQTISRSNLSATSSGDQYDLRINTPLEDNAHPDHYVGPSPLHYAISRAASRGTNPWWAVICCNSSPCPSDHGHFTF